MNYKSVIKFADGKFLSEFIITKDGIYIGKTDRVKFAINTLHFNSDLLEFIVEYLDITKTNYTLIEQITGTKDVRTKVDYTKTIKRLKFNINF